MTLSDGHGVEIKIEAGADTLPGAAANAASEGRPEAATPPDNAAKDAPDRRGAKPRRHARVTIDGLGTDREFDSIGDLAHDQPAIAAMVVGIVSVVFFAPVLAIALILWYRMRKARMTNETMLKLAEKGIVPPAEALDALSGGKPPAAATPLYQQAQEIRRRAAWSDLRKGVMVGGVGLALSLYSLIEDREANALGLVLLCVGTGFVVLWWFEERHLVPSRRATPDATPGSGNTAGNPPPV